MAIPLFPQREEQLNSLECKQCCKRSLF